MIKPILPRLAKFACLLFLGGNLAAQSNLTVNSGYYGVKTSDGSVNDVWSSVPPTNMVFDKWTGGTSVLADPLAWHTAAVMPSQGTIITANYKSAPAWTTSTWIVNGLASTDPKAVNVIFYFPPHPVGVIFFFHGAGGSAIGFYNSIESTSFAREAVATGYAVASLDSNDRVAKTWSTDTTSSNVDTVNVRSCVNYFVNHSLMTSATPKYATGMSEGGGFAPKPAYTLAFQATGIWCAAGAPTPLFKTTTVPTIWCLAKNDDATAHSKILPSAQKNQTNLTSRSIAGQLNENPPSQVYPMRFLRIPGLLPSDSQTIFNVLKSGGYLNSTNYLLADPQNSGWQNGIPSYLARYDQAIGEQLEACYSGHLFYSDYDDKVLAFFNAHR